MDDEKLSIQNLSSIARALEEARKATYKKYIEYKNAKEMEETIRFQLYSDLSRFGSKQESEEK